MKLVILSVDDPQHDDRDYMLVATNEEEFDIKDVIEKYQYKKRKKDYAVSDIMQYLIDKKFVVEINIDIYWYELLRREE